MRWHRLVLLLALTGCGGEVACPLIGCVSQLTVRLPADVTSGTACVADVCTSDVMDGTLLVPLARRAEESTATVTVTLPSGEYEGRVPLTRTRPNGPRCPPVCVNGEAVVDAATGAVVPVRS